MDRWSSMNELPLANSEVSADSEADSGCPGTTFGAPGIIVEDEDDAESCSGGADHAMGDDQRLLSWKSWLMEMNSKYECNTCEEGEGDGMSTMEELELVDDKESNRC
ncbi:hypothetical protein J5N97_017612 [Dioscorea zingiberensis]|uniref:Uncharacterized protein n=1 Tax=Dioscorea zingiberensis TaxID=325984 RepID=A0A9D5HGR6_9LILI|nr:hypothetical protein J5N97_017612 [Dioscorea zingiberensis]